ncbi:MAG: adenylyltransferase/cytidyltransferase family protein [bacterium]
MVLRNIHQLRLIIRRLHAQKKKVVFTNSCFDLLHVGHLKLFEYCKKQGDYLIVAVNSDRSIRAIKGPSRPIIPEQDRAHLCAGLKTVDAVIIFNEETPEKLIAHIRPDVLVKGGDWKLNSIIGRDAVKKVVRMPLIKGKSTTAIIQKIRT